MTSRRRDLGELSPRLLDLSAKTTPVEPYQVTNTIVIRQTRKRRDDLHAAYNDIAAGERQIRAVLKQAAGMPQPEAPGADATVEQADAYGAELDAWHAQIDVLNQRADEIGAKVAEAGERYNRAFFGDQHDAIMELTADWDPEFWDAFKADVNDHFQRGVNTPPDGTDDDGNVVDAAEAVEAGKSST